MVPKKVWLPETADNFVIMSAGGMQHTIIPTRDKTVWSCGSGCHGVLGTGNIPCRLVPTRMDVTSFKDINKNNQVIVVVAFYSSYDIKRVFHIGRNRNPLHVREGGGGNVWFQEEDGGRAEDGTVTPRRRKPQMAETQAAKSEGRNWPNDAIPEGSE